MTRPRLLATVMAAALAGYAVVQLALRGGSPAQQTASTRTSAALSRTDPPGERSDRGAVAAASNYLRLLDLAPPAATKALRSATLAPLTGQALQAAATTAALKRKLSPASFVGGWRLGWRVDSSDSRSATVALWTVGTVAGRAEVVAPDWSTTVCVLRWWGGRWRVSAARTVSGPTPPAGRAGAAAVSTFARAARTFHPFTDAP